jgi:hypothetical protein
VTDDPAMQDNAARRLPGVSSPVGGLSPHAGGLVEEQPAFQSTVWRLQRIAWVVLAVFLVLSCLGLSGGGGVLARASVGDDQVRIDYPRILRRESANEIVITVSAASPETVLLFDATFHDSFAIGAITPVPASSFAYAGGVAYRFEHAGQAPAVLRIAISADRASWPAYRIVTNGRLAMLDSVILP